MAEKNIDIEPEKLTTPLYINGRFKIPWPISEGNSFSRAFKIIFSYRDQSRVPSKEEELNKTLPVMKPDFKEFEKSPESGIRHMWIGHASSLVQFDGITLLTDPVFSDRCAPIQWLGPKRFRPPPCTIADLPKIDCVIISHTHYDHLDYNSVKTLNARFGDNLRWYVPMGLKQWMNNSGCTNVVELTWWQEHLHSTESGIKFVSTPALHWSGRTVWDKNKVLWSSWCVLGPKHKFCFVGDSGYCEGFKEIGKKYGPFTLSTIPIGAYHPTDVMKAQHVDPAQAVVIHQDIKSQQSVGIHWGTFKLSYEFYMEPKLKIVEELEKHGLLPSSFVTVAHGDIQVFGGNEDSSKQ